MMTYAQIKEYLKQPWVIPGTIVGVMMGNLINADISPSLNIPPAFRIITFTLITIAMIAYAISLTQTTWEAGSFFGLSNTLFRGLLVGAIVIGIFSFLMERVIELIPPLLSDNEFSLKILIFMMSWGLHLNWMKKA